MCHVSVDMNQASRRMNLEYRMHTIKRERDAVPTLCYVHTIVIATCKRFQSTKKKKNL